MTHRLLPLLLGLLACGGTSDKPRGRDTTDSGSTGSTPTTGSSTTTVTGTHGTEVLKFDGKVPSNILFLSIDTLRKDHVGAYGDLGLTPFLDQIAAEGVVIDDFTQCSGWTFGSVTCTLGGRTNIERGHMPRLVGNSFNRPPVPVGTPFLADWLGQAGYYSALVSGNTWLGSEAGNTNGYVDQTRPPGDGTADLVAATGIRMLDTALANDPSVPWFLHLHHMEPHARYWPPDEYVVGEELLPEWPYGNLRLRRDHYGARDVFTYFSPDEQALLEAHLRVLYAGEVRFLDHGLSESFAALDARGYLDDTLVVIWTDHGEAFWEHGYQTHAYALHGEENDAALIFWAKNIVPGRFDEPVASIDLVPTLLELQGLPIPPEVTGVPIGKGDPTRPIFTESLARLMGVQAVVKDGYKLHFEWEPDYDCNGVDDVPGPSIELYDRHTDPGELVDLYDPTDPKTLELWALLKPQVEAMADLIITDARGCPQPHYPPELP